MSIKDIALFLGAILTLIAVMIWAGMAAAALSRNRRFAWLMLVAAGVASARGLYHRRR